MAIENSDFTLLDLYNDACDVPTEIQKRTKLGQVYKGTLKGQSHICRKMDFERLTPYQIESYFAQLTRIHLLKLTKYVIFPKGVFINQ